MNILEIAKEFLGPFETADAVICLLGILLFALWLLRTSFGTKALVNSPNRRNNMPLIVPFILFIVSFGIIVTGEYLSQKYFYHLPNWQFILMSNFLTGIGGLVSIVVILILAKIFFVRGIKGFGLNIKTIHKDFPAAFINLLAIWPIMLVVITLTMFFAKIIKGPDYQLQPHQELISISENPVLWARIAITVTAIIVTPFLEELLFRGLLQTTFRSVMRTKHAAWIAIALTSVIFAMMHAIPTHWPTLFVLGLCMGYSYEKSGSLYRPIFIHAIFNAISIIGVWIQ